jgi:FAD binding domain
VIDLSLMKGVRVSPAEKTIRTEAGCTQADANHAAHSFGLAVPVGVISTTGIAGLTLGGGTGNLTRKYGWLRDLSGFEEYSPTARTAAASFIVVFLVQLLTKVSKNLDCIGSPLGCSWIECVCLLGGGRQSKADCQPYKGPGISHREGRYRCS